MTTALVTGPTGFLGYHVIKQLNEKGIRPRVLLPGKVAPDSPEMLALNTQDVEIVKGEINDVEILRQACEAIDTVFHLYFAISFSGGKETERHLHEENVLGTCNLIDAAAKQGVSKMVISSSSLAVGMHHDAKPLDETDEWETFNISLPYAESRRNAEQAALAKIAQNFPEIIVVNPSFTLGPEDWVKAPANQLVMRMSKPGFRFTAPIGFGILDVRDFADGVLRAAEYGKSGRRYILSSHNTNPVDLAKEVANVVGFKPPKIKIPLPYPILFLVLFIVEQLGKLTKKPPKISRSILKIWNRYAWYDNSLAKNELGWNPRPLQQSIKDTIDWHRSQDN